MKDFKYIWIIGLVVTALIIVVPIVLLVSTEPVSGEQNDPWESIPADVPPVSHADIIKGPFETGSDVTRACLECHEEAAQEMMKTVHWKWEGDPVLLDGREEPVTIGKKNQINNFCIGIQSNWEGCTRCHAGYGWEDENFDFSAQENIDCLVCHDQTGTYVKSNSGLPDSDVDLLAVAQSVANPTRANCGGCHFNGGGGNAVKHGDLDSSLFFPTENIDVHMGRHDFECVDCHKTEDHDIRGRAMSATLSMKSAIVLALLAILSSELYSAQLG